MCFFDRVVDPWLRYGNNKEMVATEMAAFLKNRIPHVVQWLREMTEKYKERSTWKRVSVWFAEKTKALDWDDIRRIINDRIDDRKGRKEMIDAVGNFFSDLREHIASSAPSPP